MYKMEITDKTGENITLVVENDFIRAYSEVGKEIGVFDYYYIEGFENIPDVYELQGMNIIDEYQRRGIGREILKLGENVFEKVIYPSPYETNIEVNHLSSEGLALLDSCNSKGIIKNLYNQDLI